MSVERPRLVLASASPRRAELLRAAGYTFSIDVADLDESVQAGELPEAYVRRLAIAKARCVVVRHPESVVLGADTTVVVDGEILGKPTDAADAARMIARLGGRPHLVHTGLAAARGTRVCSEVATTTVWFGAIGPADIAAYVASGEPMDKAGAYGIQGAAARFVARIEGDYDTVVGLSMAAVRRVLETISRGAEEDSRPGHATTPSGAGPAGKPD